MGLMILIQLRQDFDVLSTLTLRQRINSQSLTSIELLLVWGVVGAGLYKLARMRRNVSKVDVHGD
jgi:hypothetical protein